MSEEEEDACLHPCQVGAEALPGFVVERVLVHLAASSDVSDRRPTDVCNAAMVSRTWRDAAAAPAVWRELCRRRGYTTGEVGRT